MVTPALQPLVTACGSAELTVCALIRNGLPENATGWAVNAFSVLRFAAEALPTGERRPRHLTRKPESSPEGNHRLFVALTNLSIAEALAMASFQGHFIDPQAPSRFGAIESPGMWVGPTFVERDEQHVRSCLPPINVPVWLHESWQPAGALQKEIGAKSVSWLHERILDLLGVSLARRRERIGNFLVVVPETRVKMRTVPARAADHLGIEIASSAAWPSGFVLVSRGSRDERLRTATARLVGPGLHVLPTDPAISFRETELYDALTGQILDREGGTPIRTFAGAMNMVTTHLSLRTTFARPDGQPDGATIQVETDWGMSQKMQTGGRATWEVALDEVLLEERREKLRTQGRFFVYRGGSDDRRRAVDDIRKLLHTRIDDYVKIWDPYFSHRDAFEFLFYVFDPTTPIHVLTSLDPTDEEKTNLKSKQDAPATPLRKWKQNQMCQILKTLREPQKGTSGRTGLEVRSGAASFHDRFIISKGQCFQLGCSFNQIGSVMSTIVEFPYPEMIEREFDQAWVNATPL